MNPKKLGPYKIQRLLGRGGMGAVYLGVHQETGEQAGVKTLSAELSQDDDFRQRFSDEIESLKKLRHPNIVQLYGWGEQDDHLFYVMEYVPGSTLQQRLDDKQAFTWQEVIRIAIEVCRALKHAHDNGIIHRDLKPANLLVDESRRIKLTDFGIAKLFGQTQLTVEGGVVGTADYMAPEQALGKKVTHRCDFYSLGAVLFALLAGRPPFHAKSLPEVVHKVCYEPAPPLRRCAPDVPAPLEALVADLLEKDPQRRPPTARALTRRLESMQHGLTGGQMPAAEEESEDDTDFELGTRDGPAVPAQPRVHSATTRFDPEGPQAREAGPSDKTAVPDTVATGVQPAKVSHTDAPGGDLTSIATGAPTPLAGKHALAASSTGGRFTTLEEEEFRSVRRQRQAQQAQRWITAGLAAALVLLVGTLAWQALVPPSADKLHARIAAAAAGDLDALAGAADDIQRFLDLYPDDPRAAEVGGYQEELQLDRLQRSFERKGRRLSAAASMTPPERAYLEAVEIARSRPEEAIAQLQAIVDVYGRQDDAPKPTRQVVALAERQLERLRLAVRQSGEAHLSELTQRLKDARALSQRDPAAAAAVFRGIILLYQDKAWAAEIVSEARASLDQLAQGK